MTSSEPSANAATEAGDDRPAFDMFDSYDSDHVYEILGRAQDKCPVLRTQADGGYYVITKFEDVRSVLEDPATFSSRKATLRGTGGVCLPPIDTDPPLHREFRLLLNPFFSAARLRQYESAIRDIAVRLIESWLPNGTFEFMSGFAEPYVSDVLSTIIFNENDPDLFKRAAELNYAMAHNPTDEAFQAFASMIKEFLDRRVSSRVEKDDVVNAVLRGAIAGRPLTDEERIGVVQLLFAGGLDTTKIALSNIVLQLAQHSELETRLRDPGWIQYDLDEYLRFESPVTALPRLVMRSTELRGTSLNEGDTVLVHYAVANRDPDRFADSGRLNFETNRHPHVAFGLGIHRCIGMHLARLQLKIAIEELLRRVTNVRIRDGWFPQRTAGISRTLKSLELSFDRVEIGGDIGLGSASG